MWGDWWFCPQAQEGRMGNAHGNRRWRLRTQMAPTCVATHRQQLNDRAVSLRHDAAHAMNLDEPEGTGAESESEGWD